MKAATTAKKKNPRTSAKKKIKTFPI